MGSFVQSQGTGFLSMTSPPGSFSLASVRAPWAPCLFVLCALGAAPLQAQDVTDHQGLIRSDRWLALGPFRQDPGCGETAGDLLANYIAPAKIGCEFPAAGDAVDFDVDLFLANILSNARALIAKDAAFQPGTHMPCPPLGKESAQ